MTFQSIVVATFTALMCVLVNLMKQNVVRFCGCDGACKQTMDPCSCHFSRGTSMGQVCYLQCRKSTNPNSLSETGTKRQMPCRTKARIAALEPGRHPRSLIAARAKKPLCGSLTPSQCVYAINVVLMYPTELRPSTVGQSHSNIAPPIAENAAMDRLNQQYQVQSASSSRI